MRKGEKGRALITGLTVPKILDAKRKTPDIERVGGFGPTRADSGGMLRHGGVEKSALRFGREDGEMPMLWMRYRVTLRMLHEEESAQDLVEYALVAVVIALAATVGMGSVAKEINDVFSNIARKISSKGS
jgi:Flp pilus assembly pilin Flp